MKKVFFLMCLFVAPLEEEVTDQPAQAPAQ